LFGLPGKGIANILSNVDRILLLSGPPPAGDRFSGFHFTVLVKMLAVLRNIATNASALK
jgi:hypothetical protein